MRDAGVKVQDRNGERGQAAVLITILLMLALIALTALAIDGGHLYVVRRDLQNMADAACLAASTEFSLGGDEDGAYQAAVDYIAANGGTPDLYSPQEGDGQGLAKGIQVSGAAVRVALQTVVDTYFTMIFNRTGAGVGARAHCNATAAGGLLPIGVRRYEYNPVSPTLQLDLLANKYADPANGGPGYPADSEPVPWEGRYGTITVYLPTEGFVPEPAGLHDDESGAIDCDVPPADDPPDYVGACVLGDGVDTNDGTNDYKGFVLLDVRNLVPGPTQYLSGATGQSNTNKDISKRWLCEGYENTPPMVGDQLAMLDGVSNDFAAQEMATCWQVGEEFVAVVYSGFVWTIPDLELTIEPAINPDEPVFPSESTPVTYTVTFQKTGPQPWEEPTAFLLDWEFMEQVGAYGVITPTVTFSQNPVGLPAGWEDPVSVDMIVYATNAITDTTRYLSALTVRAAEFTGVGARRWASSSFRYGDVGSDFTVYARDREINVPQDGTVDIYLVTSAFGGFDERNVPVHAEMPEGPLWETVFQSSPDDTIRRISGVRESRFTLKVQPDAPASEMGTPYTVQLTVGPAGGRQHSLDVVLNVHTPKPGGTPNKFVIVQGFAPFRISYVDANTIGAYAVGAIVSNTNDLTVGMQGRLVAW